MDTHDYEWKESSVNICISWDLTEAFQFKFEDNRGFRSVILK